MGKHERRAYLQALEPDILNESCEVCGYARKYAIRLLNRKSDNITPRQDVAVPTQISG